MQNIQGLYKHIRTGQLYSVLNAARNVADPSKFSVVYLQNFESKQVPTGEHLPIGTMWIRDLEDFMAKFKKVT